MGQRPDEASSPPKKEVGDQTENPLPANEKMPKTGKDTVPEPDDGGTDENTD
jgi:hypothetical protein